VGNGCIWDSIAFYGLHVSKGEPKVTAKSIQSRTSQEAAENKNRGQSTKIDTPAACILGRRGEQRGRLHKAKAFQIITDPRISAASTPLSSEKHSCSRAKHDHGLSRFVD